MNVLKFSQLEGFRNVDYISKKLRLTRRDVARILELRTEEIAGALNDGFVAKNTADRDKIHNRLYNLHMLYGYLLTMSDYKLKPLHDLWKEKHFWNSAIVKPPWYENGLKDYLLKRRHDGLESCIEWIRQY